MFESLVAISFIDWSTIRSDTLRRDVIYQIQLNESSMENSNSIMNLGRFFNGNNIVADDLSPVSVLRLNFDRLPTETTDPVPLTKNVFGVPVPEFVPDRILSWIDDSNADFRINQHDGRHQWNVMTTDTGIFQ